ncbi:SapC family protein [Aliiglaciecola sp. CAU 1673]|uniref:SapC family protein n=1 Tax=Aliiglaciecola sp. CAU 1673 TaxID=3032595 RepID=UPI0023DB0EB8|nr:SapC family protein [Aliiglaciecola sp. CAU 1673]MDF2178442.1 SapC family protein [Aliiglaciecola sp. CAU 1673]
MAKNYVLLDKEVHKDIKIKQDAKLAHAKQSHLIGVSVREFARASSAIPLVLIKDQGSDRFYITGLYGLVEGSNYFVKEDGWKSHFAPMNLQRYPFDIRPNGNQLSIFIDENSELVNKEEGVALFNEDGTPSQGLENLQKMLGDLVNSENMTREFIKQIIDLGLIEEIRLGIRFADGEQRSLTGLHSINEEKLLKLSDEEVVKLHRSGFLGAIYAMLGSMGQLNRLVQMSQDTDKPVEAIQILPRQSAPQPEAANA